MIMIDPAVITEFLSVKNVSLVTGVPDSVLSGLSDSLENGFGGRHIIAANEGNSVAIAIGHYMGGGGPAALYLQNSGLGNIINPIVSLAHADVYQLPMFLIIGWRGSPGISDEPQHVKQGQSTKQMLDMLDIPFWDLDTDKDVVLSLNEAWDEMEKNDKPVAILIKKGSLSKAAKPLRKSVQKHHATLSRENAIKILVDLTDPLDALIATTGKSGRELFEIRVNQQQPLADFLTVGGMGHASSIALGVALQQPKRRIICLDGDGALLMHMGGLAVIGDHKPKNLIHVLLNNESHDSVGGQPTVGGKINIKSIVLACGYANYNFAYNIETIIAAWDQIKKTEGPFFLEISIKKGARHDLGRPTSTTKENKINFMSKLAQ